jgi:hypothetical protein
MIFPGQRLRVPKWFKIKQIWGRKLPHKWKLIALIRIF